MKRKKRTQKYKELLFPSAFLFGLLLISYGKTIKCSIKQITNAERMKWQKKTNGLWQPNGFQRLDLLQIYLYSQQSFSLASSVHASHMQKMHELENTAKAQQANQLH